MRPKVKQGEPFHVIDFFVKKMQAYKVNKVPRFAFEAIEVAIMFPNIMTDEIIEKIMSNYKVTLKLTEKQFYEWDNTKDINQYHKWMST